MIETRFQYWHHMTMIPSSIPSLNLLVQDDQNDMHMMSHDANSVINGTILFVMSC